MKIAFRKDLHLSKANKVRLNQINTIIEEYRLQGYKLTLRQLYYQLVSRDIIPNNVKEYSKIGNILTKGRMGGIVDWEAIEDRVRVPDLPYFCDDVEDAISDTINYYRKDRQEGQKNYVEMWVEKDALSNILREKTHDYHIRLMVNRGYSSCTAMYDSFQRFAMAVKRSQTPHILYLGDHDPSGLDMIRDISDRLEEFGTPLEVKSIALTMPQIELYNPPPNPAKLTDPRAKWYVKEFGNTSWEVDALNPQTLHEVIDRELIKLVDMKMVNAIKKQEVYDKNEMKSLPNIKENLEDLIEYTESSDNEEMREKIRSIFGL